MSKRKVVLFINVAQSSFILNDQKLLSDHCTVLTYNIKSTKGINLLKLLGVYIVLLPYYTIKGVNSILIWFSDYHAFLPLLYCKVLGIKSTLIVGGYDVVADKSLKYGAHVNKFRSYICKMNFDFAFSIVAVSDYIENTLTTQFKVDGNKIHKIYNCVSKIYKKTPSNKKTILTVCSGSTMRRLKVKGIDTFLKVAIVLPDYNFVIVGLSGVALEYVKKVKPKNLRILPFLNSNELLEQYQNAKVYCQFSKHESFGIAVIESIMSGCIPLVNNCEGLSEIVDYNNDFLVDAENISGITYRLVNIMDNREELDTVELREHIRSNYSCSLRRKLLLEIL